MKITLLCLLFSSLFFSINAQEISPDIIDIDIFGTPPDFNYDTISDYETTKIANNAIRIDIDTKEKGYHLYFRSDGPIRTSSGQKIPESKFGLRIHNTIQVLPLSSNNDHLLIAMSNKNQESYSLDFIVSPLYFDYDPGNYTVNILFTLTKN